MPKNLVVVESPAKAKTIEKYLGKDFKVLASYGHVRDLPKSELGIDTENNFEIKYIIPTKARKNLNALKKEAEKADELYLATDLDREGEAIAWHISEVSKPKNPAKRVVFSEITKDAILEAFKNPRKLDENLIDAQQARRVLDRLVGYKLSPLLWQKIRRGLSAGRVQSVTLRLIIEREEEIKKFKPEEYWNIEANLSKKDDNQQFLAKLTEKEGKRLDKLEIKNKEQADQILKDINNSQFIVQGIIKKEKIRNPYPPYKTSTLQQDASRRLYFSAKKTMMFAQQLYEGIALGEKGSLGLITYMRTDSLNMSQDFIGKVAGFIEKSFGANYKKTRQFKTTSKGAQEAHEAIRPTDIYLTPDSIKDYLDPDQLKLYSLIYNRALASQMSQAIFDTTQVKIKASQYGFTSSGSILKFDGFLKVYNNSEELGEKIPELKEGEELDLKELKPIQSFTQPPARYTEASLVKVLEEYGIGRPSTYAPTMSTIVTRGYVQKEKGFFMPQEIGFMVNKLLVEHFSDIVNVEFTAKIEEELDEIAQGKIQWIPVVREFYEPFEKDLENKYEEIEKIEIPVEKTDIKCEKCGKPMVIKIGRFGKFLACSGFPECKNAKPILKEIDIKCPKCGEKLVERRTKRGRTFYGCKGYPSCKFATWEEPIGPCEKCAGLLVKNKKDGIHCMECDFKK